MSWWRRLKKPSKETILSALTESDASSSWDPVNGPAIYAQWRDHAEPGDRMSLITDLISHYETARTFPTGLMIILGSETDVNVATSAAMGLALLMPNNGKSFLAGPEFVITLGMTSPHLHTKIAALAGILLLGDKRVMPLLREPYRNLTSGERKELSFINSAYVWAGMVEFWTECLEDEPEAKWGRALWALSDLPTRASSVLDVEREFPAYRTLPGGKSLRIKGEWSIEEFGRTIESRLRRLGEMETQDPLMPRILEAWGIDTR